MHRASRARSAVKVAAVALLASCTDAPAVGPTPPSTPTFALLLGTETQITDESVHQLRPVISGERIVWSELRGPGYLSMYDISTATKTPLFTSAFERSSAEISGDLLVWRDGRNGNWDIYMYDFSTGIERQITSSTEQDDLPAISGNRIVYTRHGSVPPDVFVYDVNTGVETQITHNAAGERNLAISGDRIVWADDRNGNLDIFLYDLSTGLEQQITTDPADQAFPAISGDRIVWMDHRRGVGQTDIYMFDLTTDTETPIATDPMTWRQRPDISGLRIVWQDHRSGDGDIYLYDLASGEELQVTSEPTREEGPRISGNDIVWDDYRNGNPDIYLFQIATTPSACLAALRAKLNEYVTGGQIDNRGIAQSLRAMLDQAEAAAARGNTTAATNALRAFLQHLEAQSGKHVDAAAAAMLTDLAEAAIGCL